MAYTRIETETLLIRRIGNLFTAVGLDGTTVDGTNADLNDPISWAVQENGGFVDDPLGVTDSDISTIINSDNQFLDYAEYKCLETAYNNAITFVNIRLGDRTESLGDMAKGIQTRLENKRNELDDKYGFSLSPLSSGTVATDIAQKGDDTVINYNGGGW